ncbi:MAG: AI-2E family transporter [Flavobacteriales bacterium]|nr:AI-2E family transporter [Flavobacteriales bacterium]
MKNTAYFFIATTGIIFTYLYGKSLLVPFIFALLLWFLVRKIRHLLDKVSFIQKHIPARLKNLIPSLIILGIISFVAKILLTNINNLAQSYPIYAGNVEMIINKLNETFGINIIENFKDQLVDFDFGKILKDLFQSITDLLSNTFLIIIFALFIFLEESNFANKLKNVFIDKEKYARLDGILENIEKSIANYIGIKTLVSLTTGIISYIALLFIGIDSPLFWAFLIFILNFIPTIGSMVATVFPAVFCLLQFGEFTPSLLVLFIVGGIQVIIGNILEPKIMGNSLNISPLVAIISLLLWGTIWGVTGMLLSIPITVCMVIIFSHFENTKPIAIMLSEKGKI